MVDACVRACVRGGRGCGLLNLQVVWEVGFMAMGKEGRGGVVYMKGVRMQSFNELYSW